MLFWPISNFLKKKLKKGALWASFLFLACSFLGQLSSIAKAEDLKWSRSDLEAWRRLYYIDHKARADVINSNFYVRSLKSASDFDLLSELTSLKVALEKTPIASSSVPLKEERQKHLQCKFPARALLMARQMERPLPFPLEDCEAYQKFKNKIGIAGVSLVFSSYFPDNPSSAFGHSLIRLHRRESERAGGGAAQLLDYGVNHAALVTTSNPLLYGLYGLTGGFQGNYTMMPYFFKIREYNDMESRDLWEYQLDWNETEMDFFVAHLFELDNAVMTYYYLRQNCSFQILRTLNVVRPDINLEKGLGLFVIPIDTVQAIARSGMVKRIVFYPGQNKKIQYHLEKISREHQKTFYRWHQQLRNANSKELDTIKASLEEFFVKNTHVSELEKMTLLDVVIDDVDYIFSKELLLAQGEGVKDIANFKQQLLIWRSQLPAKQGQSVHEKVVPISPDHGHASRRISLGGQWGERTKGALGPREALQGMSFQYRFALHDLLDSPLGHNQNTELEMGNIKVQYWNSERALTLEDFRLASVISMRPINDVDRKFSYLLRFGAKDEKLTTKREYSPYLKLGSGVSFELVPNFLWSGALLEGLAQTADFGRGQESWFEFGPHLYTWARMNNWSTLLTWRQSYLTRLPYLRPWELEFSVRYGTPTWGTVLEWNKVQVHQLPKYTENLESLKRDNKISLSLQHYFY